ncbi:MAG: hypothetical protein ACRDV3_08410 [Acidothermaceae bacterium]
MSRTPAREALIASGAVSAVISLCVVGGIVTGSPADATVQTAASSAVVQPSIDTAANRALMSGSYRGVWFSLDADAETSTKTLAEQAALIRAAKQATAATPAGAAAQGTAANAQPPQQSGPAPANALHQQSRSSALAAVSGQPREIAQTLAATHGWTGSQWTCLDKLWNHESQYETTVRNTRSGAYGIPQALPASKMASAGADWRTNPVTQIVWGLSYISARYGTPCGAWSYWVRHSSY